MKDILRQLPALQAPLPSFDAHAMPVTPQEAFALWFESALAAGIREPHAMTLSTVDAQGWPDARVLILKNVDDRGWHFSINSASPKARQIEQQDHVALTFYWPALGRQIRLRGQAKRLSAQECAQDFLARPLAARAAAMAGMQSEVLAQPQALQQRLANALAILQAQPEHVEAGWCVYAVDPAVVEFWQGASDRNHIRWRYHRAVSGSGWSTARLWP